MKIKLKAPSWWPWISKKHLARVQAEADKKVEDARRRYDAMCKDAIERRKEQDRAIDKVLRNVADTKWRREGHRYQMTLSFDPRVINYGNYDRTELREVAQHFARVVESEIMSSKFIKSAEESEYERTRRPPPRYF